MDGASSSSSHPNVSDDHHLVDDFYFSALHDDQEVFPISDEKYAQELQLQEALMSSALSFRVPISNDQVGVETPFEILKGQSSSSGSFCMICIRGGSRSATDLYGCDAKWRNVHKRWLQPLILHPGCIGRYVGTKIQESISMVKCPDVKCKGVLEPQSCRSFIPQQVFERWENALCESSVLGSQKFYCPFKDCSAMLVDDGGEVVTASECPNCRRLFCVQCRVVWQAGIDSSEFQKLSRDERGMEDIMVMELAKKQQWRRCPRCPMWRRLLAAHTLLAGVDSNFAMAVNPIGVIAMDVERTENLKGQ